MYSFIEQQLVVWDLARENYRQLAKTERRLFDLGEFKLAVQHNPARIRSTGAAVDKQSIAKRSCFLCEKNRPPQQTVSDLLPDWDTLLNPYPIFPVHFTIASKKHQPQGQFPLDMICFVEKCPGLVAFFNGAHAGASSPDHLHFQAVLKSELPILRLAETVHNSDVSDVINAKSLIPQLPFDFYSFIIKQDSKGMRLLKAATMIKGSDNEGNINEGLVNDFVWIDNSGTLRIIVIPRKAHRPACYAEDSERRLMISPGAVDMAGVIITPVKDDFEKITKEDLIQIYSEVAHDSLPSINI